MRRLTLIIFVIIGCLFASIWAVVAARIGTLSPRTAVWTVIAICIVPVVVIALDRRRSGSVFVAAVASTLILLANVFLFLATWQPDETGKSASLP